MSDADPGDEPSPQGSGGVPSSAYLTIPSSKRRWHPKVTTGCITCRFRRVRCDEGRPVCRRCSRGGRTCEGYTEPPPGSGSGSGSGSGTAPPEHHLPHLGAQPDYPSAPRGMLPSDQERQMFHLLATRTVSQTAGCFDRDFWTRDFLQATREYPAIWHAGLALAAMHQGARASAAGEGGDRVREYREFARTHRRISTGYTRMLDVGRPMAYADKEAVLLSTVLYAAMSCLQGCRAQALVHVRGAMQMVAEWRFWEAQQPDGGGRGSFSGSVSPASSSAVSSGINTPSPSNTASSFGSTLSDTGPQRRRRQGSSQSRSDSRSQASGRGRRRRAPRSRSGVLRYSSLMQLLLFFYRQFDDFGDPFPQDLFLHFNALAPETSSPFASVTEAYFRYLPIHLDEPVCADDVPGEDGNGVPRITPTMCQMLTRRRRIAQWKERFRYLAFAEPTLCADERRGLQLLRILCDYEDVFQGVMLDRTPENWARHRHRWAPLVDALEAYLAAEAEATETALPAKDEDDNGGGSGHGCRAEPVFSFSCSALEVLRMIGMVCRDGEVRRRVVALLQRYPRADGIWDSEMIWLQVDLKMHREEEGPVGAARRGGDGGWLGYCGCVPDLFVCVDHRVREVFVDFLEDKVIRLSAQTGYEFERGLPGVVKLYALR